MTDEYAVESVVAGTTTFLIGSSATGVLQQLQSFMKKKVPARIVRIIPIRFVVVFVIVDNHLVLS